MQIRRPVLRLLSKLGPKEKLGLLGVGSVMLSLGVLNLSQAKHAIDIVIATAATAGALVPIDVGMDLWLRRALAYSLKRFPEP